MKMTREDPRLTAYALGELTPSERAAVEAELSQSPECRQAVEEIRETATLLARELATEPCPELRGTQQEAVLALVPKQADAKSGWTLSELWGWFAWRPALVLAGAAVGVAAAVLWWPSREARPPQKTMALTEILTNGPKPAPAAVAATANSAPQANPPSLTTSFGTKAVAKTNNLPAIEINKALMVTVELDFGPKPPTIGEALREVERRYEPEDGQGRTFAILDAYGEPTAQGKLHMSMHVSLEKPGVGRLIFRRTGEVLWESRIVAGTNSTLFTHKNLAIYLDDGTGKTVTIDGSHNPATILAAGVKEAGVPVAAFWPDGAEREMTFLYSACGCPVKAMVKRMGDRTVRTKDLPVMFPDDPSVMMVINRLLGGEQSAVESSPALPASSGSSTSPVLVAQSTIPVTSAAMAPLLLKLPMPSFKGTPDDLPFGPHIEPVSDKPRPPFLAPAGVQNVALGKKVTSSDKAPISGSLDLITDGNKEAIDDAVVEMHKNVQWVQIDLEADYHIYAIVLWHDHRYVQVFRCVVVQAADDPDFTGNVQTLFNNDYENVAGLGLGKDKQYFETNQGKLIGAKGIKARYLRFYSKGSNASALNCYTEIEVYALPAQQTAETLKPLPLKLPMPAFKE